MEIIRPTKQGVWGWPGVVNFILGGMAAGFYLLSSLTAILQNGALGVSQPERFKLLAPVLTSLGFLALMIGTSHIKGLIVDASHPLRSRYLFRHLRRSWMSRETLASVTFILAAVLDWLFPHLALWVLASAAATGLMISHGFILYRVRAVTAWNVPLMPLLFLTSSFTTGSGLMLLVASGRLTLQVGPVVIGLICVVLDLVPVLNSGTLSPHRPG
jgi:phenylacetyl-CoA:acceptor oxidoreductase subunit 2